MTTSLSNTFTILSKYIDLSKPNPLYSIHFEEVDSSPFSPSPYYKRLYYIQSLIAQENYDSAIQSIQTALDTFGYNILELAHLLVFCYFKLPNKYNNPSKQVYYTYLHSILFQLHLSAKSNNKLHLFTDELLKSSLPTIYLEHSKTLLGKLEQAVKIDKDSEHVIQDEDVYELHANALDSITIYTQLVPQNPEGYFLQAQITQIVACVHYENNDLLPAGKDYVKALNLFHKAITLSSNQSQYGLQDPRCADYILEQINCLQCLLTLYNGLIDVQREKFITS